MRILNRLVPLACSVVVLGLLVPVNASKRDQPKVITPPMDILYAAPGDLNYAYGPQGAALQALTAGDRPATATITVTYTGFSPQAQAAFQAGIDIWKATITSPAPIRIAANFTPLGSGILGSARASVGCQVPGGVANTYYAAALADKINGSAFCAAAGGQTSEIIADFNSNFADWEFGTAGVGVPGKYNFMTVVMHEVGHGLGFFGRFTSSSGIGSIGSFVYIYDRKAISGGGTPLTSFANPSAALHAQLTSNNTFWNTPAGPKLETHNMTTAYGYTTDNGWLQGSSYSHLDDVAYSGTPNGLMTFALSSNEVYTDVGPLVRTVFTDSGWTVNSPPAPIRTLGDFTGDGRAEFAVFRPATGQWTIQGLISPAYGLAGDIPVPGDYNGDGFTEIAVFRPANGTWYFQQSGAVVTWGLSGDIPVPGDYNGDGVTDLAVFRTSNGPGGTWFIRNIGTFALGLRGDIPVPADYDGDGKTDIAVFRPSTGTWYRTFSSTSGASTFAFGLPGDIPVPAKFDGDTKADVAVYRPSTGTWYISQSLGGATVSQAFGLTGDVPLALDTDGDGVSELTVWRPASGTWFTYNRITTATASGVLGSVGDIPVMQRPRLPSAPGSDFDGDGLSDLTIYRVVGGVSYWYQRFSRTGFATNGATQWGLGGDIKVPGDFDGDHKTDFAVFRPSNGFWYILQSATGTTRQVQFGLNSDVPMAADYDGDGRTDPAVFRPSTGVWYVLRSSSDYTSFTATQWGLSTDVPKSGDFDGDGRADFAVFRPSTGVWYLKMTTTAFSADTTLAKQFGLSTDLPISQDFDGDGRTDLGIFRGQGEWLGIDAVTSITPINQQLGLAGDTPIAHDYDGDGRADAAVWRPATGQWFIRQSSNGIVQTYQWGLNGDQPVLRIDPWK
jgi:hypothetical protein